MYQDAEGLVVRFYRLAVPELTVVSRVPSPRPRIFVRCWRTGGAASNRILDNPILTTEVWGTDAGDTDKLPAIVNRLRSALYGESRLIPPARGVEEVAGPYWDPDPDSGAPRMTFSAQLALRASG